MAEQSTKIKFSDLQSDLLKRLEQECGNADEFLQSFCSLESDVARVDILYERLQRYGLLQNLGKISGKNDKTAILNKKNGDRAYLENKRETALKYYTKCITEAKSSTLLAEAYIKIAKTLNSLNMFDESVEDTIYANECSQNSPKPKTEIGGCSKRTFHEETPFIPKYRRYPHMSCASSSVQIHLDKQNQLKVFAARDIEVGEVIAVEKPLSFCVTSSKVIHCHECFRFCHNPIPCKTCSQVVYCCNKCGDDAFSNYHRYECPLVTLLNSFAFENALHLLALKMTFQIENMKSIGNRGHICSYLEQNYDTVGAGLFPFYSVISHCEEPNVFVSFHGSNAVMRVVQPVKKGEELYVASNFLHYCSSENKSQNDILCNNSYFDRFTTCEDQWADFIDCTEEEMEILKTIANGEREEAKLHVAKLVDKIKRSKSTKSKSKPWLAEVLLSYFYQLLGNKRQIV